MSEPALESSVPESTTETFIATFRVVDRGRAADTIRDLILGARQRLIVLYGKSRSGKTEFVQNWLIPGLRAATPGTRVVYGKCDPDLPTKFESPDGSISLDDALAEPSILVVDRFDRFLAQPREERREATERAFARFEREGRVKVVLVTDSSQLANAYALTAYDQELVGAVFEIPAVTIAQGLASLSRGDGRDEISYDKDALGQISAETRAIEKQGWEVTFDLIRFLDRRFRSYAAEHSKSAISRTDLKALGGVSGVLREHLATRIERSSFDTETEREILQAILESIAEACQQGRSWNAEEISPRLGVPRSAIDVVLYWLESGDGVLARVDGAQDVEFSPPQLGAVVLEESETRGMLMDRVRRIVDEGMRSWERLGSLLSLSRFAEAHRARRFLVLDETSSRFLLLCALRYDVADSESPAAYWLGRISDRVDAMDILLAAVFDDDARVRVRAAELLRGFPEPEAYERLSIVALVDDDASVRAAAVSSLGAMEDRDQEPQKRLLAEVQERFLEEVKGAGSPYRDHAIAALRVFPSSDIAKVLQDLVDSHDTDVALRERAIQVLAALEMPESVDALLEIALKDRDEADRNAAAAALAVIRDEKLAHRVLTQLEGFRRVPQFWLYVAAVVWLIVVLLGFTLLVTANGGGMGLLALSTIVAPIPTAWLLRRVRDGRIARNSPRGILTGALFAFCAATSFYLLHGLAHLLIGRWRRASVLLALEVVSFLLINAGATFTEVMKGGFAIFYFVAGVLLFVATYVYDVGAVLGQTLFLTAKSQQLQRKALVYQHVMSNPVAAQVTFDELASFDKKVVARARALLKTFGQYTQPEQLVHLVQSDGPEAAMAARALKVSKGDDTVRRLETLWKTADQRLRSVINGILCGRPTQSSLQALERLRKDMTAWMRVRENAARWNFRMAVWPAWGRILAAAALPAFAYFAYNGFQASRNPAWSQLVTLRRNLHQSPLPSLFTFDDGDDDQMINLIGFLAQNHPNEVAEEFLSHLTEEGRGRRRNQHLRAALANGLLVIAVMPKASSEVKERVRGTATAAFEALFLGDSGTMPAALSRLGLWAATTNSSAADASVRLLSRLVRTRVPEPDSAYLVEAVSQRSGTPDSTALQQASDEYKARAESWKVAAVSTIGQFSYDIALPALDTLLRERSESSVLARALRDNVEYVTNRAFADARRAADPLDAARRLLAALGSLESKPELTGDIQRFVARLAAQPAETRVVIEDPSSEDGYQHAFAEYDQSGRYQDAVLLFTQLKTKYPESIWPRKFLSLVHHENLAVTDPASFAESYRQMRELIDMREYQALRSQDAATYFRILADYDEIALSARDFETVERLGRELTAPEQDHVYRFNSALFVYFARVISRDSTGAGAALSDLRQVTNALPLDFYNNWRYPGTVVFIRRSGLRSDVIAALLELCKEGDWFTGTELQAVLNRNRAALSGLRR